MSEPERYPKKGEEGSVWYSFMSGFTSSFTTSIAKQPALCLALWSASLKTLSHRVKHTVKLQKHGSPPLMKLLMKLFSKKTALLVKLSCAKQGRSVVPK
jgi:formate hydrogenlyase subunit 4